MLDIFEILGPIMVGPSSSHTAGAVRIGRMARTLLGEPPVKADILVFPGLESLLTGQVVLAEDAGLGKALENLVALSARVRPLLIPEGGPVSYTHLTLPTTSRV